MITYSLVLELVPYMNEPKYFYYLITSFECSVIITNTISK